MKTNTQYWNDFVLNDLPDSYKKWFKIEKEYLQKHITKDSLVLEIACGNGRSIQDILPITENITGLDHDPEAILAAKKKFLNYPRINFQLAEASELPYTDETFDFVICMGSFYNFADKKLSILNEMKRVLKKSGFIILDVFSEDALEERLKVYKKSGANFKIKGTTVLFDDGIGDKVSEQFTKEELENIFSQANLHIKDITKINIAYLCKLKK